MSPFPSRLVWFTVVIVSAALAAALTLFSREGSPDLTTVLIFGILVGLSAQFPVALRTGVALSPGLLVCMAAIVVFAGEHSLLGALLVCSLAHIRVSDLRRERWGWVPFNAAVSGLSFLAAAVVISALHGAAASLSPLAVLTVVPSVAAYLVAASSLIVLSYLCEGTRRPREVLAELGPVALDELPFAVLGFLVGRLYLSLGAGVLVLVIVPILIAREMFRSYIRVAEAHDETVQMLIRALEKKDPYTAGHAERVADYAGYVGEELGFGPLRMERLRLAALMHDIGKLVVPNHILNKPGRLTEDEFRQIRLHEKVAVQMLNHIDFLRPIARSGHSDEMRLDIDDPDHPIEPYIVMIADAFDAMTSTRSYRKALPQEVAFQELRDKSGVQFHPRCVEALIDGIEKRGEQHGAGFEGVVAFENAPDLGLGSAGLGDLLKSD